MTATRDDVVAFALELRDVGANPADPEVRQRYLELVAPEETPQRAAALAQLWGCGLVVGRGVLGAFIEHPILAAPYRDQHALSDLVEIGRGAGALHGPEREPEDGDIVIVGGGPEFGGPWHAWMRLPDGYGLDGGQKDDDGYQVIRIREHEVAGGWDTAHDDQTERVARRRVRWVIDVETVLAKFGR